MPRPQAISKSTSGQANALFDELRGWLEDGLIHLLSTADHLPGEGDPRKLERFLHAIARRSTASESEIARMIAAAVALTLPALAVDGELVFTALPTAEQLVAELRRRDGVRGHGA